MLITWLTVAGSGWVFVVVAEAVLVEETRELDRTLILALRTDDDPSDPLGPPWMESAARDVTALGSLAVLVPSVLGIAGALLLERRRRAALVLLLAVGGGQAGSLLLKLGFARPRPEPALHATYVQSASFPSGHAMLSAVTYLTLAALLSRVVAHGRTRVYLVIVALLTTVAVGLSRVYLGVHWPTDVLAGWVAGGAWAVLCWLVARSLQAR